MLRTAVLRSKAGIRSRFISATAPRTELAEEAFDIAYPVLHGHFEPRRDLIQTRFGIRMRAAYDDLVFKRCARFLEPPLAVVQLEAGRAQALTSAREVTVVLPDDGKARVELALRATQLRLHLGELVLRVGEVGDEHLLLDLHLFPRLLREKDAILLARGLGVGRVSGVS